MRNETTLGIDTAAGISLGLAGATGTATWGSAERRSHVEDLIPAILALLEGEHVAWADIRRIGVGVGPGPFTGLRVGLATAQTLGFALGVPVRGVCSLDVVAADYARRAAALGGEFIAALDARRKELYWARYDAAGHRVGALRVSAPDELPELPVVGPGAGLYRPAGTVPVSGGSVEAVDAGLLAAALDGFSDAGLEPLYLRQPDAELPGSRKSVLTSGLRLPDARPEPSPPSRAARP